MAATNIGDPVDQDVNLALTADADAAVAAATGLRLMGYTATESDGTPAVATANIKHGATGGGWYCNGAHLAQGQRDEIGMVWAPGLRLRDQRPKH